MLLSDRDITAAIAEGRLGIDPYDKAMVQPSSVDVRLDRYFRVFENHRYPHIDPAEEQGDLTRLVEDERPGSPMRARGGYALSGRSAVRARRLFSAPAPTALAVPAGVVQWQNISFPS